MKLATYLLPICLAALVGPAAELRAAAAELPAVIPSRQKSFVIPFRVVPPPTGLKELPQVDLYVSIDRGETWKIYTSAKVDEKGFKFRAELDGEYSFAVRPRQRGKGVAPKPRPELRVLVDTAAPELELAARCDEHGVITAQLKVTEDHLLLESVKLEYRPADSSDAWEAVALDPIPADLPGPTFYADPIWKPQRKCRSYAIRAEVQDKAGNPAVAEAYVEYEPVAVDEPPQEGPALQLDRQVQSDGPRTDFASTARESAAAAPLADARRAVEPTLPPGPRPITWPADETDELPGTAPRSFPRASNRVSRLPAVEDSLLADVRNSQVAPANAAAADAWRARTGQPATEINPAVGSKFSGSSRRDEPAADWVPPGIHPRMVNATKFQLDYDVEAVGPWGIRRVELWGTRDYGRTWSQYGADDDNQSPLTAQVDAEGIYGFRVLVQSGSGLVESPPKAGDVPEVWVRIDQTVPVCRITGVDHGSGERAGQLIIHWDASDALPAERPISLAFSPGPNGPWQPIASGLRNTGRYVWQLDQRTPDAVYLRLECRDEAGNVAVYQPTEPVTVVPLRPRARIREVRPFEAGRP